MAADSDILDQAAENSLNDAAAGTRACIPPISAIAHGDGGMSKPSLDPMQAKRKTCVTTPVQAASRRTLRPGTCRA